MSLARDAKRGLLAACLVALVPTHVRAEGEQVQAGEASLGPSEGLLREAVAAYALGDVARAKQLFEEAHLVEPTARTLRGLGIVALREGRHADAVRLLREALASPVKPLPPVLREGVTSLLAEATAQTAELALVASPSCEALLEAGRAVAREPDGHVLTAPGFHRYTCIVEGHAPQEVGVTLDAGGTTRLELTLTPLVAPEPTTASADSELPASSGAAAPPASERPLATPRRLRARRAFWGFAATTGAFGVAAIVTGVIGRARIRAIEDHCGANEDGLCGSEEMAQLVDAQHLHRLSVLTNTWLGLGGVSAAGSLAVLPFYLHTPASAEAPVIGLRATWTF